MVPLTALLLPILLSAVIVFRGQLDHPHGAPYHRSDYQQSPKRTSFFPLTSGWFEAGSSNHFPFCTHKDMNRPLRRKFKRDSGFTNRVS